MLYGITPVYCASEGRPERVLRENLSVPVRPTVGVDSRLKLI